MTHVLDDLELYAVGALAPADSERVASHLTLCTQCRAAADEIAETVAALADALPAREPPAALKDRIIAAARAEARPARRPFRLAWPSLDLRPLAMAAAVVLVLGFGADQSLRLRAAEAQTRDLQAMAERFAYGGRTWYMAGVEQWKGAGGNLLQPSSGGPPVVLFHDLPALEQGKVYAVWLINTDGKWVRGTSFRPDGRELQLVALGQELAGYERCAVTIETSGEGKPQGPVVMQSRIAPPSQ